MSAEVKKAGNTIGFVPTMGFLHEGHLSLVRESKKKCDKTFVSVFINPAQFAPSEDLNTYPRNLQRDTELLEMENVDLLFVPKQEEIYQYNFQTFVSVEKLSEKYEGEFRPTHFKGVTTIVSILFNCVNPDYAFFGQKDAQQLAVIRQMVMDLKLNIRIVGCPIVREADGLAMSSRNVYLSPDERIKALNLHKALLYGRKLMEGKETDPKKIIDNMKNIIAEEKSIRLDYIAIVNACGFRQADFIEEGNEYYILVAARVGQTRLIDNELVRL